MTAPAVTATRLVDGAALPLAAVMELQVTAALASPALRLRCTAAVDAFPGELGEVTVRDGDTVLFTGRVDRQTAALSAGGRTLTLEARSKGALLLDNEALPCVLTGARLSDVFRQFIAPYGFVLYHPGPSRSLAAYTVHKGLSEWEALTGFTWRVYGCTPFVRGDQVMVTRPESTEPFVVGEGGAAFARLEHAVSPYSIVSEVALRDDAGSYGAVVRNPDAAYYGVRRKRYLIPTGEYADTAALDANQRIRKSMMDKEAVLATLPGIVRVALGREARVACPALTLHNLLIGEVVWRLGRDGVTTRLRLLSAVYYD